MIRSFLEKLSFIPNEIAQGYKELLPFFSGIHVYLLLLFLSLIIITYILFRLKIKPQINRKLPIHNSLLFLIFFVASIMLTKLIGYENPILSALGFILLGFGAYGLSLLFVRWLMLKKPILAKYVKLLIVSSITLLIALLLVKELKLGETLANTVFLVLKLSIFIIAIQALLHKEEILSILPEIDFPLYKKLKLLFRRFYFLFLLFAVIVGGFWITGYEKISRSLFWRFLGLTAFIIGLSIIHQLITKAIKHGEKISSFSREIYYIWVYFEIIISFIIILKLLKLYDWVLSWLKIQIIAIGGAPLSLSQVIEAILIGSLFYLLASLLRKVTEAKGEIITENLELRRVISKTLFYAFILIGLLASLRALGIGPSLLAVFAGTLGIGLGLGLQDLARNIVGGILIFMEGHFKMNDIISLEINSSSPITGRITKIDYRCVTLRTFDNTEVILPSSLLASNMVMNWTKSDPIIRRKITIGVSYSSDPRHVEKVILEEVRKHPDVLPDPQPMVLFREIGESALIFDIFFWIDQNKTNPLKVTSDINFNLWYRFKEEGIEIPYPQLDVRIK